MSALFCRAKLVYQNAFNKDVLLLPNPTSSVIVKHCTKQQLLEHGHILNGSDFQKSGDQKTITGTNTGSLWRKTDGR